MVSNIDQLYYSAATAVETITSSCTYSCFLFTNPHFDINLSLVLSTAAYAQIKHHVDCPALFWLELILRCRLFRSLDITGVGIQYGMLYCGLELFHASCLTAARLKIKPIDTLHPLCSPNHLITQMIKSQPPAIWNLTLGGRLFLKQSLPMSLASHW